MISATESVGETLWRPSLIVLPGWSDGLHTDVSIQFTKILQLCGFPASFIDTTAFQPGRRGSFEDTVNALSPDGIVVVNNVDGANGLIDNGLALDLHSTLSGGGTRRTLFVTGRVPDCSPDDVAYEKSRGPDDEAGEGFSAVVLHEYGAVALSGQIEPLEEFAHNLSASRSNI